MIRKRVILCVLGLLVAILVGACITVDFEPLENLVTGSAIQGRWCRTGDVGETLCYEFVGERIVQFSIDGLSAQHEGRYDLTPSEKKITINFFEDGGFEETLDYAIQDNTIFLSGDDPVAGGGGTGRFAKQ